MKVPKTYYDEIFDFSGQWGMPSKCGLKILKKGNKNIVIVTEMYQENPGTSVTQAAGLLFKQICENKRLDPATIIYLECNPDTHSKLSFYDEEYFQVLFKKEGEIFVNQQYKQLCKEEINAYFN
jgi:hypothetical protein